MFDWFYKRIAQATIGGLETFFSNEDNIKQLTDLTDALVDRQMQRVYGKIGGTMKGVNAQIEDANPLNSFLDKDGSLDFKSILGKFILPRFMAGIGGQSGGSPSAQPLNFKERLSKYGN